MSKSSPGGSLGYCDPEYVRSLSEFGSPRKLEYSGGWIIERLIAGTDYRDAAGPYPIFQCKEWNALRDDLEVLKGSALISLVLVSDPMTTDKQRAAFRHFSAVRPFKTHYLTDLSRPYEESVSSHHRYYARKAEKNFEIDIPPDPGTFLDEWSVLYERVIERHSIRGLRAFSQSAFKVLLKMNGVVLFRALENGKSVGAQIFVLAGDVVISHLAAFTADGYSGGASYFLDSQAIRYFRDRAAWINWGGGQTTNTTNFDGLAQYKKGWSTDTRTSYILGYVFNDQMYSELSRRTAMGNNYFPAYRWGEHL